MHTGKKLSMSTPGARLSMPWKELTLQLDYDRTNANFNLSGHTNPSSSSSADAQLKDVWLEIFDEIYKEGEELFKKVFSKLLQEILSKKSSTEEDPEDFRVKAWLELHKKIPTILHQADLKEITGRTMQRSMSLDSPRKILLKKPSTKEPEDNRVKAWLELIKKIPTILYQAVSNQSKVQTMQRSLSLESPRTPHRSGEESTTRLERFKVVTFEVGGIQQDSKGGTKETKK